MSDDNRTRRRLVVGAVLLAGASALARGPAAAAQRIDILETGSTLLYPLFNLWTSAFSRSHPEVRITTQGTGSGAGVAQTISGIAQIGASDAYMSNAQIRKSPSILNIPLAVSSQMVNYNVPGLNDRHLRFSGPVLAEIYKGSIGYWDDAKIRTINPGVKLPHQKIVPVHRSDGSGDTFLFTQYLSSSAQEWASVGYGVTVSWPPAPGGIGAQGNPGMVNALKGTPYAIGYIGISFKSATEGARLGEAQVKNKDGNYVLATDETVAAALQAVAPKTPPDQRISLIFAPGAKSYPIVNYEYAIVNATQPSKELAAAIRNFLSWAIDPNGGAARSYLEKVGFVAVPPSVRKMSQAQIDKIK